MAYTYHPHIADVRMKLETESVEKLFEAGLQGMSNMIKESGCDPGLEYDVSRKIELTAVDPAALLVDFLSSVLTITHTEKVLFCQLKNTVISENHLSTTIMGRKVNGFDEDIKAVTHHEAIVWKTGNKTWKANIIFDI